MTEQPMQGGYRRPENPAPVSGPGRMSRRTDGQGAMYMSGGEYGEGQDMMDLQQSAPMSKTETRPRTRRPRASEVSGGEAQVTPLFAPTQRPDEPITAGMPFGAGPGEGNMRSPGRTAYDALSRMRSADGSSEALAELAFRLGV